MSAKSKSKPLTKAPAPTKASVATKTVTKAPTKTTAANLISRSLSKESYASLNSDGVEGNQIRNYFFLDFN